MEDGQKKEKTILVVEDEENIRMLLAMRLKVNHFRVLTAGDGEEALAVIREKKPDLVILDLMLPKITGYELCRMIKFDEALKSIPVIIHSSLERQVDRDRASEAGADAYFIKPFELDLLIVKINQLLQRPS
jgi:DNA-binding response OmpR family regulator